MLRISRIEVENFKSLVNFSVDLPKSTCLIGLNGSGKSTVLQFLDFLSRLVIKDGLRPWLDERGWQPAELLSRLSRGETLSFSVDFEDEGVVGRWSASFHPSLSMCFDESIELGSSILDTKSFDRMTIRREGAEPDPQPINFDYEGSILSQVKEDRLPPGILGIKKLIGGIQALDQLGPDHLRRKARESSGTLGTGGRNLSAFIYEMTDQDRAKLVDRMRTAYPRLKALVPSSLQSGWKQLEVQEEYWAAEPGVPPYLVTEARHINDGMLRVLAILAEIQSPHPLALFDEIENGINPRLVEFVVDSLVGAEKQVVVTTHSPMILNYMEDDVARESVINLYKEADGRTRSIRFFDIPSLKEKLRFMGPGEAFVDTDLLRLDEEINDLPGVR